MDAQPAMRTIMDAYRRVFSHKRMTTAADLRSTLGVNLHHDSTSICSVVERALHKLIPSDIRNAAVGCPLGALVSIGLHSLNVQFFQSNQLICINQFARCLVREVTAAIGC